ncbi:MAG: LysM domain-containing protein [Thermodesulfobacteriota bacterium]|nr:LysM domain-containing protein [Thermodesulfobacteriota bacterium]
MDRVRRYFACALILMTSVIGCAHLETTPEKRLVEEYLRMGRAYEDNGHLIEAFKQFRLAVTVDPHNLEAIEGRGRVEQVLRSAAQDHFNTGQEYHRQGKYGLARREFLMALRLWPDHTEAMRMLTSRKRAQIKRYVLHTIAEGETLSKLAMTYYGDYSKFPIIAKYNNITDATRVEPGQTIKIPEVEGVGFRVAEKAVKTEGPGPVDSVPLDLTEEEECEAEVRAEEEFVDQIAVYRESGIDLFRQNRYQEAIDEFNKVLCVRPDDSVALEYSYKSHFEYAMALFEEKDYLTAVGQFTASLQYKKDCQESHAYISKSSDLYKEMHYKKGMQFFDEERLVEAIGEWELVRSMDPNYKRVALLINQARTILKNIEKLKERRREEMQQ